MYATVAPGDRIMCVTSDQCLLFYESVPGEGGDPDFKLSKRLIGYNEEIIDLKYVGVDSTRLAVATNLEQVYKFSDSVATISELVATEFFDQY